MRGFNPKKPSEQFNLYVGINKGKPMVSGKPLKKKDAYAAIANAINAMNEANGQRDRVWDVNCTKNRVTAYIKIYKNVRRNTNRKHGKTGYGKPYNVTIIPTDLQTGITDKHKDKGIDSIDKLREHLVPFYGRLHALFGRRTNVMAPCTVQLGVSKDFCIESRDNEPYWSSEDSNVAACSSNDDETEIQVND